MIENKKKQIEQPLCFNFTFKWGIISWLFFLIRALLLICYTTSLLLIQNYLIPLVIFARVRRYISCVINLIYCRIILLLLGFIKFDCQNFRFFDRHSMKFQLKSGYIGIGAHKNIIDFLYYSYLFTPIFTKLIIYHKSESQRQIYYSPLSYLQAWSCALSYRGFQPTIVNSQQQFKKIKLRKMTMPTLISQSFQQSSGPIFIMLPGVNPSINIGIDQKISKDILQNQNKFSRVCIGFNMIYQPQQIYKIVYVNQLHLILTIINTLTIQKLTIIIQKFKRIKYQVYDQYIIKNLIDNFYGKQEKLVRQIRYQQYIEQLENYQKSYREKFKNKKKDQDNEQKQS